MYYWIGLLLGAVFIVSGALYYRFPKYFRISSGRKTPDMRILARLYGVGSILAGVCGIITYYVLLLCGNVSAALISIVSILLSSMLVVSVMAANLDRNPGFWRKYAVSVIFSVSLIITSYFFYNAALPADIILKDGEVEITGMYGFSFSESDISSVQVVEEMPHIMKRKNGVDMGDIKKGVFTLDSFGTCRLYLMSSDGPYLHLTLSDGTSVIYCSGDRARTMKLYDNLVSL